MTSPDKIEEYPLINDDGRVSLDRHKEDPHTLEAQSYSLPALQPQRRRFRWHHILLVVSLLACFAGAIGLLSQKAAAVDSRPKTPKNPNKIAFATLLSINPDKAKHEKDINDDEYFVATRLLCYQLLHDPQTRNRLGAPFIVMTTPAISQAKIDRLKKDGATIFNITEPLVPKLYHSVNQNRYQDVWSKLLIWKWTQYERVLFIDNDMILSKPLDDLFQQPESIVRQTLHNASAIKADEGPLPSEYLWSPIPEIEAGHEFPLKQGQYRANYPNAGFFLLKPSLDMFQYMMSILAVPGKFDPIYPEQNFMNYVFRQSGNMPWTMLDPKWSVHRALMNDVIKGAYSIHEKWWWRAGGGNKTHDRGDLDLPLAHWMRSWR
ncbi:uncharacterized protein SPSC_02094 [Sporisorium scitamineum]|uniref:Uncharacterized protein n=1 Tax=Sporisorium scitamineum TaxID=49012 RepID=A0A0F7RTZ2_9BASI|nr:hypothetical protein [Sporisorium scitamineum]CDU23465.1 uncharacterized protein SPSC_02094 [Sporisorium scitamineum]